MRVDSPVLVQDQLFCMGTDDKRREANSQARGWDGGQSARAPGTPGLARAPTRRLIPWQFHTAERGKVWCFLPACAGRIRAIFMVLGEITHPIQHSVNEWRIKKGQKCADLSKDWSKKKKMLLQGAHGGRSIFVIPFTNSSGKLSPHQLPLKNL